MFNNKHATFEIGFVTFIFIFLFLIINFLTFYHYFYLYVLFHLSTNLSNSYDCVFVFSLFLTPSQMMIIIRDSDLKFYALHNWKNVNKIIYHHKTIVILSNYNTTKVALKKNLDNGKHFVRFQRRFRSTFMYDIDIFFNLYRTFFEIIVYILHKL